MLQADLVIFISEFAKNVIEKCTHKPFSKAVVIHHGISSHFRNTANNSLLRPKWLTKDDYFLYVSILDVYKAQIEVVQAYALLRQRRDTKEKLILAGPENPDYGERLRSEIARLTLENDVLIVGAIPYDQLPAIYQHAKINIFASECENCPNILLEALGAGRPLFASNRPPMPEFGGDAAVYFDPAQPDMLAERIATVIDDPVKMSDLSSKAKIRAMQYQWDETASKTWRAILELHFAQ